MPVLAVAAVLLGTWYLSRRWSASSGPAAVQRIASVLRWVWKGLLALLAVAALAAMAQGCDGREGPSGGDGPDGRPCVAYHAEDCTTGGLGPTTTAAGPDLGEPDYAPCPAFHEEDCPPAPAAEP